MMQCKREKCSLFRFKKPRPMFGLGFFWLGRSSHETSSYCEEIRQCGCYIKKGTFFFFLKKAAFSHNNGSIRYGSQGRAICVLTAQTALRRLCFIHAYFSGLTGDKLAGVLERG